jgi:hypothetical protein
MPEKRQGRAADASRIVGECGPQGKTNRRAGDDGGSWPVYDSAGADRPELVIPEPS